MHSWHSWKYFAFQSRFVVCTSRFQYLRTTDRLWQMLFRVLTLGSWLIIPLFRRKYVRIYIYIYSSILNTMFFSFCSRDVVLLLLILYLGGKCDFIINIWSFMYEWTDKVIFKQLIVFQSPTNYSTMQVQRRSE